MHSRFQTYSVCQRLAVLFLLVLLGGARAAHAQAPVSWWRGDGNALDSIGGNNGVLSGGVRYGPGTVNQAFAFDGTNGVVNIPDTPSLAISGSLRITANIYVNDLPSYLGQIFFRGDDRSGLDPYGLVIEANGNLDFHLSDAFGNNADIFAPVPLHQWVSVDVSLDNVTGKMQMILNHQVVAQMTTSIRPFQNLDTTQDPGLAIGNTQDPGSYNEPFSGSVDELKVYNTASSTSHLLWGNTSGAASLWTIIPDGTRTISPTYGPYSGWTAKALSDGPDGTTHVLWTNSNGTIAVWNTQGGVYQTEHDYGPFPGWTAKALSTGIDGQSHVLWTRTDGIVSLWNLNTASGAYTYAYYGPYSNWTATALASGATTTDLLWSNTNGQTSGWKIAASGSIANHEYGPYPSWGSVAVSVGPDDGTHLLWDKSDGTIALWSVDFGSGVFSENDFGPFSGWTATALATGPDNVGHVLWSHAPDGQASVWSVSGGAYTDAEYGPFAGWSAVGISAGP